MILRNWNASTSTSGAGGMRHRTPSGYEFSIHSSSGCILGGRYESDSGKHDVAVSYDGRQGYRSESGVSEREKVSVLEEFVG